jgi:thiamine-monophosphate kinase
MGDGREFDAIRSMLAQWGSRAIGIGDDAAVLVVPTDEQLVVSTDASVEGVHFRREWMSPAEIGERAASAALSDLAAMAATPVGLLLAIVVPERWEGDLPALARGVGAASTGARCPIVGGNLSRGTELSLTITVLGSARTPLGRAGAHAGDRLFVTGRLGGPGAAVRAYLAGRAPALADRARFVAPIPRLDEARWLADHGTAAAIDISDGLLADAAHLARASGVTVAIDIDAVPRVKGVTADEAAASGEEYELIVAVPEGAQLDPAAFARTFGISLTAIGRARPAGAVPVLLEGRGITAPRGHDHLR